MYSRRCGENVLIREYSNCVYVLFMIIKVYFGRDLSSTTTALEVGMLDKWTQLNTTINLYKQLRATFHRDQNPILCNKSICIGINSKRSSMPLTLEFQD